ncbi:DUF2125 domain-containing protein [Marivita sp. GX14005]|uniref:DUF2125 domain-containing protein n=1 Tax=Marivita sp. GX14005 TaxID=2942276 RepID=UPI0020195206|nr:DUF2125 domain-containing protein [Marivita sp. GX14005]
MKRLLAVIALAALVYGGWWVYAAQSLRGAVENGFAMLRTDGWTAGYDDLSVRGFPNRTDLTVTGPRLTSPDGRIAWRAPFVQMLGLSYNRDHVILAWPDAQSLRIGNTDVAITSDGLRASVVKKDGALLRSNLEAPVLNISTPEGSAAFAGVTAALEKIEPLNASYRLAVIADRIALSAPPIGGGNAPDSLSDLRVDLAFELDAPLRLDRLSAAPRPVQIAVRHSEISYGALTIKLSGDARIGPDGYPTGEVRIMSNNWRAALEAARDRGHLPRRMADRLIEMLTLLSGLSGARDTLDVTLGLRRGGVFLGPLKIGQLPPFPLR